MLGHEISTLLALTISLIPLALSSLVCATPTDLGVDLSGHFITKNGKPIFLLGDTAWPLAVRFEDEQIRAYLDDTKKLGFNVIALFQTTSRPPSIGRPRTSSGISPTATQIRGS